MLAHDAWYSIDGKKEVFDHGLLSQPQVEAELTYQSVGSAFDQQS